VALTGTTSTCRIYLRGHSSFSASGYTLSGPVNPGSKACHLIPKERRYRAASVTYYACDWQRNPTTPCPLLLL
jgi:hypothetical protein